MLLILHNHKRIPMKYNMMPQNVQRIPIPIYSIGWGHFSKNRKISDFRKIGFVVLENNVTFFGNFVALL